MRPLLCGSCSQFHCRLVCRARRTLLLPGSAPRSASPFLFLSSSLSSFLTRVCREHRPFFPPSPFLQCHRSVSTWPRFRPRRFINRHHHRKAATLISHATAHRATTTSERLQHTNRDPPFLSLQTSSPRDAKRRKKCGTIDVIKSWKRWREGQRVTSWRKLYK